jgi:hypothetical protein
MPVTLALGLDTTRSNQRGLECIGIGMQVREEIYRLAWPYPWLFLNQLLQLIDGSPVPLPPQVQ